MNKTKLCGSTMFEGEDLGNGRGHPDLGSGASTGGGNLEQQLKHEQVKMEHMAQVPG